MLRWLEALGLPIPTIIVHTVDETAAQQLADPGTSDARSWALRVDGPWESRYLARSRSDGDLRSAATALQRGLTRTRSG